MERLKKLAVILELADKLKKKGSWCGETHLQKTLYFLQEMAKVPTGYEYILYKHGPFSFDFRDEISSLISDRMMKLTPQPYPFGPSLETTEVSENFRSKFKVTLNKYCCSINFLAEKLADEGVASLERLSTALYVFLKYSSSEQEAQAQKIVDLKPHVSFEKALAAVQELESIRRQYDQVCTPEM